MTVSGVIVQTSSPSATLETSNSHISLSTLGMWVFLVSDAVTFATLLVSCAFLRAWSRDWPTPAHVFDFSLAGALTCLLLASSGAMASSCIALAQGNLTRFNKYLLLTLVSGLLFILLQTWEWSHLLRQGLTLTTNPWGTQLFGASFYLLTGFHGCHVIAGLVYLTVIWIQGLRGVYHPEHTKLVFLAGLYWYFVDVCWLFILPVVYFP